MIGADRFIGHVERAAGRRESHSPAGASAVPAVHSGKEQFVVLGRRAVVGPSVVGGGSDYPIDAAEFTNPQVDVHAEGCAAGLCADMGEHREDKLQA